MTRYVLAGLCVTVVTTLAACAGLNLAPPEWSSAPEVAKAGNESVSMELRVKPDWPGPKAFTLTVVNATDRNVELNWNKTLYVREGQTSGGFMFEGIVYAERNNSKPPDIIFPRSALTKTIWPTTLTSYQPGRHWGWHNEVMSVGMNGAYVTVVVDGKEVGERLELRLKHERPSLDASPENAP